MKEISYNEYAKENLDILSKGAFLTVSAGGKVNTMTIAWGSIGFIWGKPVFMAMVRPSRFTYELLEKTNEFTVTLPHGDAKAALALCGSKSGRDMDKIAASGLETLPAQKLSTPVLDCTGVHYECKILYKQTMSAEQLDSGTKEKWYGSDDYHTLYFGEILASYIKE